MSLSVDSLAKLMYETYESAAFKNGWYDQSHTSVSWAFIPDENKDSWRDAVGYLEQVIRDDESQKYQSTSVQVDLKQITDVLNINTHDVSLSPHELVQYEILPKIIKMKGTLVKLREFLDDARKLL